MVISLTQGPMDMVVLSFNKGFSAKVHPVLLLCSIKIGCLTLSLKEETIVDLHCLLVLSGERSMMVDV